MRGRRAPKGLHHDEASRVEGSNLEKSILAIRTINSAVASQYLVEDIEMLVEAIAALW